MYTECPGCRTAFRITADMLQQAAGNVRCGDCGRAFNALENLSEDLPEDADDWNIAASTAKEDERALLDTLDEFVGPVHIRIEDTGVEWRVYDDESVDTADPATPDMISPEELDDTASARWYIEDIPLGLQEPLDLPSPPDSAPAERYDDNTPLPDTLDEADDPALTDTPRRRAEDQLDPRSPEFDERQADLALSEPEDWTDLLAEVGQEGEAAKLDADSEPGQTDIGELGDDVDEDKSAPQRKVAELPSDIDTQFDLQAQQWGIDLTGDLEPTSEQPTLADEAGGSAREQDLATDSAAEWPARPDEDAGLTLVDDEEGKNVSSTDEYIVLESPENAAATAVVPDRPGSAGDREPTGEFERRIALAAAAFKEKSAERAAGNGRTGAGAARQEEHPVPPQTEEEKTINMLIDRDLLRLAAQEDVFRTTSRDALKGSEQVPLVETIIMEGDTVRHAIELAPPVPESPGGDTLPAGLSLKDTYVTNKERMTAAMRRSAVSGVAVAAGVAVLALLFAAQVVHAYRETLATYRAFDQTVGSVYRLLGVPITPDWNIDGWQFEATSGSTGANDQVLTISSRITNRSDRALPYPLLHVSLTDRWEENVGSRVLEPEEYLAGHTEPLGRVAPGDKFTGVVTIAALSAEATGFKLNVCYRLNGEQVRCATGAFKD